MSSLDTDNLAELIRKKHQILVQLREIGLRQQKLVDASATAELLKLLGAKQHLIGALQMVERSLRPFQAEDPEQRVWRSPADREACAQRAAECQTLLNEVMQLERAQEAEMSLRRDEAADRLKRASSAKQAVGAYAQHLSTPHRPVPPNSPTIEASLDLTSGGS